MTDIPNELVETGALAIQRVTSFGHYEATDAAMAALLAVGLPALLERVEAVEGEVERLRKGMLEVPPKIATVMGDEVTKLRAELAAVRTLHTDKIIAFDALAAKAADAGERIAQAIEVSCDAIAVQPCRPCRQAAHIARTALAASETP